VVQTETVLREVRALLTLGVDPAEAKRRASGLLAVPLPTPPPSTDQEPAAVYTFGAWLEEFKPMYARYRRAGDKHKTTVAAYIRAQYEPRFGHLPCLLPFHEVQRWMDELAATGHSRHTIRNYFAVLNTILNWAVNHGRIERNPLQNRAGTGPIEQLKPARPKQRRVWLSHAQFRALIAATPDRYKAFFIVMTMCGLRVEEAIGLRWRDVLLDAPLDGGGDGVVDGPGALLVRTALSNPTRRKADRRLKDTKTGEARAVALGLIERDWLADLTPARSTWRRRWPRG
jgi:integrase